MTATNTIVEGSHQTIGEIVQLLHRAYEQTWDGLTAESPRMSLGLGIYLVHAQACTLLPIDYWAPLADIDDDHTVVQLLGDAEHRTRTLPLHRSEMAEISDLVVALCDLIREANHLDR